MNGQIQRRGSFYLAIAPGRVRLEGEYRTKSQALAALNEYNISVHQEKIDLLAKESERKAKEAEELKEIQAVVEKRKAARAKKKSTKNKSTKGSK